MPADLVLPSKTQHVFRPRRMADLDLWLKIVVPLSLLASLLIAVDSGFFHGYLRLFQRNTYTPLLSTLGAVYALAFLVMQLVRTILWWRYRPYTVPAGPLPRVTVLIPAYNEGAMVEKALYSVATDDYPKDLLEIICIDDGSRDDTWNYIQQARQRYPHLIQAIRFPKNRGKREALYAGFLQGQGDYFVTVDSDSVIEPGTLQHILAPLLQDPKIGAVAGNVKVYNRSRNVLTRMLWVRFVLSFDFLRASQSMYGFVFCTPGALSAYRREVIMPILDEWRHQTFLGVRCTIGEDRAFTNLVLRQGYDTVYQRSAVVYTTVPENYRGLSRMFLRWDRSNFRESLVQLSYMFTRYRLRNRLLPILDFVVRELEFPMTAIFLPLMLASFLCCPILIVKFVSGMALVSFVLTSYYLRQERDADFIYGVIYSFYAFLFLRWVRPYAFFTLRDGRWLTR
ncbi:MAG: glycosyltransferase [Desulfobaccales bacterium]